MARLNSAVLILLGTLLLAGCGPAPTTGVSPPSSFAPGSPKGPGGPATLPTEYRTLAENLALDIKSSPDQYRDNMSFAEVTAELHKAVMVLRGIQSPDRDITYIADQGQSACSDAVGRLERINALPKPPGAGDLFVSSFVDGFFQNYYGAYARGRDAEDKQGAIVTEVQGLIGATDKLDAAQMLLPKAAAKYAAPLGADVGRISLDFDESWGAFGPYDWLHLLNAGADLEDCTILVEITGLQGEVRKNVHFIRSWPGGSRMSARYLPGYDVLGRKVCRQTVKNVNTIDVTILSPHYSTQIHYVYPGAEKDKDFAARCKNITLTWRYQPFEKGVLWDTNRGVVLTLDGITLVPKCRVDVTYKKAWQSRGWHWEFDRWDKGETKTFSSAGLDFDPDTIEVVMSFPGTNHRPFWLLNVKK